jgi:H+/Cl- antiporter ClcA
MSTSEDTPQGPSSRNTPRENRIAIIFGLVGLASIPLALALMHFSSTEPSHYSVRRAWWAVVVIGPLLLALLAILTKRYIGDKRRGRD